MTGIVKEMRRVVTDIVGSEKIAVDIVYALIKNFGGERLYFPINDYDARNREIISLYKHGADAQHLAKRYRLSVKTVYRIINAKNKVVNDVK